MTDKGPVKNYFTMRGERGSLKGCDTVEFLTDAVALYDTWITYLLMSKHNSGHTDSTTSEGTDTPVSVINMDDHLSSPWVGQRVMRN